MSGSAARNIQTRKSALVRRSVGAQVPGVVEPAPPAPFFPAGIRRSNANATINPATAWPTGLGMSAVHNDFPNDDGGPRCFAINRRGCDLRHHVHASHDAAEHGV